MNKKIAILSDIHGNYEALKAVLDDMDKNNVDDAVSLGDNIGYGPDPNIVLATLKLNGIPSVMGNHELAILNPQVEGWFNHFARVSLRITKSLLTPHSFELISKYPDHIVKSNIRFVHGAPPQKILTYLFEFSESGILDIFNSYNEKVCFAGHTHQLKAIVNNNSEIYFSPLTDILAIKENSRYIINAGSVGQPRDKNKKAKYIIFHQDKNILEIRYIDYDKLLTKEKILKKGFPAIYAQTL